MRQIACLVFNSIMVEDYTALFSCTAVVQASDDGFDVKLKSSRLKLDDCLWLVPPLFN